MELTRSYTIDAPIERVWTMLMDTAVIAECIPGCGGLEPEGDDRYRVQLAVRMAAVMGQYAGTVALVDVLPMRSYRLVVEGRGRPGFVHGDAAIGVEGVGDGTRVSVEGTVQTGGSIARVGQRIIGGAARFMVDAFFERLKALAERGAAGNPERREDLPDPAGP